MRSVVLGSNALVSASFRLMLLGIVVSQASITASGANEPEVASTSPAVQNESVATPLDTYRGIIRIWKCDWALDPQSVLRPGAVTFRVFETRFAPEGVEQWALTWQHPYRPDLTPDFRYLRTTESSRIEVNGNSQGPRAVILAPDPATRRLMAPFQILKEPQEHFLGREPARVMQGMDLRPSGLSDTTVKPAVSLSFYETREPPTPWKRIQAVARRSPHARDSSLENVSAHDSSPLQFDALDLRAEQGETKNPDAAGTMAVSYRVLERQTSVANAPPRFWDNLPRLIFLDEVFTQSRSTGKSYHHRSLELLEFFPDPEQQLLDPWDQLLPRLRIADLVAGTARVNSLVDRDQCQAWKFLTTLSPQAAEFLSLMTIDLRERYPAQMRPIAPRAESSAGDPESFSTGESFSGSDPICALPTVPALLEQSRIAASVTPATSAAPLPLLEFVAGIRTAAQDPRLKAEVRPVRRGNQPVTADEMARARRFLSEALLVLILIAGLCLTGFVVSARGRSQRAGVRVPGAALLLATAQSLAAAATPDIDAPPDSETSVRTLVNDQFLHFPDLARRSDREQTWDVLQTDRRALARRWRQSPRHPPEAQPTFEEWIRLLNDFYRDVKIAGALEGDESHASSPRMPSVSHPDVRTGANLGTILKERRTNCYALALLYHLHCRMAGISTRLLAQPGHVLICTETRSTPDAEPQPGLTYDAVRRHWLSDLELTSLRKNAWCLLDDDQITAVLAYNLGTACSRRGDLPPAVTYLELAVRLRFPFPDAVKNLCLTHWNLNQPELVVRCCEDYRRQRDTTIGARGLELRSATSRQVLREIEGIHARALSAMGRTDCALKLLESQLHRDSNTLDFRLYRVYVDLKSNRHRLGNETPVE